MKTIKRRKKGDASLVTVDPEVLGGEPVFVGTRVPVKTLFEHLEANCTLDEFLEWFPSVERDAAVGVLMAANQLTLQAARQ